VTVARNIAIILALAAAVAFIPGGGTTAAVAGAVLSTLILVALVFFVARLYRDHRLDLEMLGDRWRGVLYGAVGVIVLAMAARERLQDQGSGGTIVWIVLLAGSAYAIYLVWRHYREYG
jgi:drug/metabolite transporter (DMT)-like permease